MLTISALRHMAATGLILAVASNGFCQDKASSTSAPSTQDSDANFTKLVSKDGLLILTLPASWHETKAKKSSAILHAVAESTTISVYLQSKEDFTSLEACAQVADSNMMSKYKNVSRDDPQKKEVGKKPCIRRDVTVETAEGNRLGMVEMCIEADSRYYLVVILGPAHEFKTLKDDWASLANGLIENPTQAEK